MDAIHDAMGPPKQAVDRRAVEKTWKQMDKVVLQAVCVVCGVNSAVIYIILF